MHDNLDMDMDFGTDPGTMIMSMIKYLQKIIAEFPETLRGTKASPSGNIMIEIREEQDRKISTAWRIGFSFLSHRGAASILMHEGLARLPDSILLLGHQGNAAQQR